MILIPPANKSQVQQQDGKWQFQDTMKHVPSLETYGLETYGMATYVLETFVLETYVLEKKCWQLMCSKLMGPELLCWKPLLKHILRC